MSDHPKIPPALTPEEWENPANVGYFDWSVALANAALPDSDPRKITRAKVKAIRDAALFADEDAALAFADALESYLPPEL